MIDFLRNWVLGITAAAIFLSVSDNLMPDSSVKKIGKFAGGLLLIIVVISPVIDLNYSTLAGALANSRFEIEEYSSDINIENKRLEKIIIEDRTGAYIQDIAMEIGVTCIAKVECKTLEGEMIYPASVKVYGELTQTQVQQLSKRIEGDLAIPKEMQYYERNTPK